MLILLRYGGNPESLMAYYFSRLATAGRRILAPRVAKLVDFFRPSYGSDFGVGGCQTDSSRGVP